MELNWKDVTGNQSVEEVSGVSRSIPRVKNSLNARTFPSPGERNVLPSLTIPDMSIPIQELIRRQAAGLPLMGQRVAVYDPEDDLPDLRTLDLAEIADLKARYTQEYQEIVSSVEAERQAKKADSEAALRKQMEDVWKQQWEAQNAQSPKSTNIP